MEILIIVMGAPILVAVAIVGVVKLIKKIKQNHKINKAIKELGDHDPYDVLFTPGDFTVTYADKSTLQDAIDSENTDYKSLGFFGKMNNFFFGQEKESSRLVKEIYKEKKEAIKAENNDDLGQLEKTINKEDLSRAKSAYRILKSENGRVKHAKELSKRPPVSSGSAETENNADSENTFNTSIRKRKQKYTPTIKVTFFDRLFKPKQYMPSKKPGTMPVIENKG